MKKLKLMFLKIKMVIAEDSFVVNWTLLTMYRLGPNNKSSGCKLQNVMFIIGEIKISNSYYSHSMRYFLFILSTTCDDIMIIDAVTSMKQDWNVH